MELRMPKLGFSMTEGTLVRWLVGEGEHVEKGQPLYIVETDKVEQEVEAPAGGTLVPGEVDQVYQVGDVIGRLEDA